MIFVADHSALRKFKTKLTDSSVHIYPSLSELIK